MREAEFVNLLDNVEAALNSPTFAELAEECMAMIAPVAANDNDAPWNHTPFPDGWIASC